MDKILDLNAYDGLQSSRLQQISEETEKITAFSTSSHLDQAVGTVSLYLPTPMSKQFLEEFLQSILWETEENDMANDTEQGSAQTDGTKKQEIWRLKV